MRGREPRAVVAHRHADAATNDAVTVTPAKLQRKHGTRGECMGGARHIILEASIAWCTPRSAYGRYPRLRKTNARVSKGGAMHGRGWGERRLRTRNTLKKTHIKAQFVPLNGLCSKQTRVSACTDSDGQWRERTVPSILTNGRPTPVCHSCGEWRIKLLSVSRILLFCP